MDPDRRYWFPVVGYNYRLTNLACALLCAQLEEFDRSIARRHAIFERYAERLAQVEGIALQPQAPWAEAAPWLFCIVVDERSFGMSRDALASHLARNGVDTRPFFHPLHRLPPYESASGPSLPVTDHLGSSGMNLPTFVGMRDDEIEYVCDAIAAARRAASS